MSNGSTTWTNTYDADGLRTKRTDNSTTYGYVYNGGSLSSMTVGSNTLYFSYDASGTPVSVTYNGTAYYYATNLQSDVTAILNSSGTAVVSYTYDAWGRPLTTTGDLASTLGTHNPLRYRGYVCDSETGLYYLQSRYYNPEIGRFINADALVATGQGLLGNNMFAYCNNNPVNYLDSTGQEPVTITITVTACAVIAVIALGDSLIRVGAQALSTFLDWLSRQWYTTFARITYTKEVVEPETPDVTYPGDDPEKAPEGYEWKGPGKQGSKEGGYYKKSTGESLRPDLEHPEGIEPHWDYNYRGSGVKGWRVFRNGQIKLKP